MEYKYIINDIGISIQDKRFGENFYKLIMTKEMFIEAYNKYIRDNISSNIFN